MWLSHNLSTFSFVWGVSPLMFGAEPLPLGPRARRAAPLPLPAPFSPRPAAFAPPPLQRYSALLFAAGGVGLCAYRHIMCTLCLLAIICVALLSAAPSHGASPVRPTQACMAVDSYHTYVCTEDAEATRRAVASSVDGSGGDASAFASAFDMDLGVEQRITGSETEQMRSGECTITSRRRC